MNRDEVEQEILRLARTQADITAQLDSYARQEVIPTWRSYSPVDSGKYAASVKTMRQFRTADGWPAIRIGATDFKAHWIEYGTGDPGPTNAWAPRAKTAANYGGDESPAP